jgi:predicted O-methyltransferase YrrM
MDFAICGDCGIDLQAISLALSIEDVDTLDRELGVIDFVLGDFWKTNKDAVISALV